MVSPLHPNRQRVIPPSIAPKMNVANVAIGVARKRARTAGAQKEKPGFNNRTSVD
jgi:hypothetical protein